MNEEKKFLSETPLNGFKHQSGGTGIRVPLENIHKSLVEGGHIKQTSVFSQVNVEEDNLVFYISEEK